jgi:hypothetical protein
MIIKFRVYIVDIIDLFVVYRSLVLLVFCCLFLQMDPQTKQIDRVVPTFRVACPKNFVGPIANPLGVAPCLTSYKGVVGVSIVKLSVSLSLHLKHTHNE